LESVYTGNRIVGSNPTPSATPLFAAVRHRPKIIGLYPYFQGNLSLHVCGRPLQVAICLWVNRG
jgi:hypothetical protein